MDFSTLGRETLFKRHGLEGTWEQHYKRVRIPAFGNVRVKYDDESSVEQETR